MIIKLLENIPDPGNCYPVKLLEIMRNSREFSLTQESVKEINDIIVSFSSIPKIINISLKQNNKSHTYVA